MSHYYTDNSNLESKPKELKYTFDNEEFTFTSDRGVFSKDGIDYGSYLLIKAIYQKALGKEILDLGCGYGVIGIILSRFHPYSRVSCVDVNPRAIELTKMNAEKNRVDINVYQSNDICTLDKQFSSIVLNPPIRAGKVVMYDLYKKAHDTLCNGGKLYIVIQKKHGANSSFEKLVELFADAKIIDKIKGHWIIEATK